MTNGENSKKLCVLSEKEKLNKVWKQAHAERLLVSRAIFPIPQVPNRRMARNIRFARLKPIAICQKNHINPITSTRNAGFISFSSPCR